MAAADDVPLVEQAERLLAAVELLAS